MLTPSSPNETSLTTMNQIKAFLDLKQQNRRKEAECTER